MNRATRFIYFVIALISCRPCFGQEETVTLEQCQELARRHFPLIRQFDLISKATAYSIENASKGYYPQVNFIGQASYQSAVTRLPISIPGMDVPVVSKDQYKLYGELNQVIYDAGAVRVQKKIAEAGAVVEKESLEMELYKLKDRVNQLYFGVLIIDRQLQQNRNVQSDLELGVNKINALIQNGTAFKSNADAIRAELLRSKQQATELEAARNAYLEMLGQFVKINLNALTRLAVPVEPVIFEEIKRPELQLFDSQNQLLAVQSDQLGIRNLPRLNLFFQGGYGRPALNMLSNEFAPYYLGGVRLSWSLNSLYTYKKELALLAVRSEQINLQRETFLFNTNLGLAQQRAEIQKLRDVLLIDQEIIGLRTNVKKASSAQLENGVITANDYLHEVNAEDQSRQNMILHEMQLLMVLYNQQTIRGN